MERYNLAIINSVAGLACKFATCSYSYCNVLSTDGLRNSASFDDSIT
jgi:hypothetical protein